MFIMATIQTNTREGKTMRLVFIISFVVSMSVMGLQSLALGEGAMNAHNERLEQAINGGK